MKVVKLYLPAALLVLFELAVGIFLLKRPEAFTRIVIILFGVILLAIGVSYLLRYRSGKREGVDNPLPLLIAVVLLAIGAFCVICSGAIIALISAMAVVYGVILIVSGLYKLYNYYYARRDQTPASAFSIASGVIAVVLGIVIVLYPRSTAMSIWRIVGIVLLVEAALDIVSIVMSARQGTE